MLQSCNINGENGLNPNPLITFTCESMAWPRCIPVVMCSARSKSFAKSLAKTTDYEAVPPALQQAMALIFWIFSYIS